MHSEEEIKSLERKAKALMARKDIPESRMEVVRALLQNESLMSEERYSSIIELIQNCPVKKKKKVEKQKNSENVKKAASAEQEAPPADSAPSSSVMDLYSPIESPNYLEGIYRKYHHLKLFRRRYLAHRSNRFGIGFRKRLIPTGRLLRVLRDVSLIQNRAAERLSQVLNAILEDRETEDPTVFNYLRYMRKWLIETPLMKYRNDEIKWMERNHFEREFRPYAVNYFSFKKMDAVTKEQLLNEIEARLRRLPDLLKAEMADDDADQVKRQKDKGSLVKEREVYDLMLLYRSFLATLGDTELPLDAMIKDKYGIKNFQEFLIMIMEALVFQRPLKHESMISYYGIEQPKVSGTKWDYSEDFLRKMGKDSESRKIDKVKMLRNELAPLETVSFMLNLLDSGESLLMKSADDQWKLIDRKHYNPKIIYTDDFLNFIDGLLNYFSNAFIPFLDGSKIQFRDPEHRDHESSVLSPGFLEEDVIQMTNLLNEMHRFRSSNASPPISWGDAKKIMDGRGGSSSHVFRFITGLGEYFYTIGNALQRLYDQHRLWVYNGRPLKDFNLIRKPVNSWEEDSIDTSLGRPIPYHDCIITGFLQQGVLTKNFIGKRVLNDAMDGGIIVRITAFALQTAQECFNDRLYADMEKRKDLLRKIKLLEK